MPVPELIMRAWQLSSGQADRQKPQTPGTKVRPPIAAGSGLCPCHPLEFSLLGDMGSAPFLHAVNPEIRAPISTAEEKKIHKLLNSS